MSISIRITVVDDETGEVLFEGFREDAIRLRNALNEALGDKTVPWYPGTWPWGVNSNSTENILGDLSVAKSAETDN